jgi:hypothetical protein
MQLFIEKSLSLKQCMQGWCPALATDLQRRTEGTVTSSGRLVCNGRVFADKDRLPTQAICFAIFQVFVHVCLYSSFTDGRWRHWIVLSATAESCASRGRAVAHAPCGMTDGLGW